ncbi:hypothetical protein BB561_005578 [Smittium simulii]|uniref:Uncharacterized protein n=1 Tax=Smittium simulii TaxID=133385 RepID=A0A2T9Y9N6_9FUNG|nr:hypothetical protein BB561_005578 [Smittium simulii]
MLNIIIKKFVLCFLFFFFEIQLSCNVLNEWESHSWDERYQLSNYFCCDISNRGPCRYGIVETSAHTLKAIAVAEDGVFEQIKYKIQTEYTNMKTFQMKIDMDVQPGTCKYIDLETVRVERVAEAECCRWAIFWSCGRNIVRWHYTKSNAYYKMMQVEWRNGRAGRGAPIEVHRFPVIPNRQDPAELIKLESKD